MRRSGLRFRSAIIGITTSSTTSAPLRHHFGTTSDTVDALSAGRRQPQCWHDSMAGEVEVGQVDCIINCVAIFYEEGKGGDNFRKKNKFRCKVNPNKKRVVKLRETIW